MPRDLGDNCFDALRLFLALAVVYSHGILLGGLGDEWLSIFSKGQTIAGSVSVLGFFGLSGFLVTMSFASGGGAKRYIRSRLLRILPGFYLTLILTAFVFAPLIAHFNQQGGAWSALAAFRYCSDNIFLRVGNWHVGEVTAGLPYDESINGSLWSLFPEFCCYGLTFLLGVTGSLTRRGINLVLLMSIFFGLHAATVMKPDEVLIAPTLMTLSNKAQYFLAFATGAVAFVYRQFFDFGGRKAIPWCLLVSLLLKFGGWALAGPVVLPIALLHVGYSFRIRLPADYSYGVYLLHFPFLQILSSLGLQKFGIVSYLATATFGTVVLAVLSWHLVERPFLRMRKSRPAKPLQTTSSSEVIS